VWIYLVRMNNVTVTLLNCEHAGGTPEIQIPGDDTVFLFNIRDKVDQL